MNHLASLRTSLIAAVSLFAPALAHAHPGHGAGEGAEHQLAHVALGIAALVFTLGLGFAARKLSDRRRAQKTALKLAAEQSASGTSR